jgi:hypothetical protein
VTCEIFRTEYDVKSSCGRRCLGAGVTASNDSSYLIGTWVSLVLEQGECLLHRSMDHEEQLVASGRGKWSKPGVPHRGWRCVDIEDLGSPQVECEMCESQTIRYVHYMQHPDFAEVLGVGCICAGHMEGDIAKARSREASMRSRTGKRKRWVSRQWRISANGNPWIRADGYRVTIFPRGGGWATAVSSEDECLVRYSRRNYPSQEEAKLAAFDCITGRLSGDA